ncbi:MAG: ATP-dependent DNA helicase RecG [Actinomycetaceae bacterium]|nr:ATP-dependent DNA helicase RecG [Actinomycetaceae bacterium]MDY6083319.1 ATP-dependent DNA helicase RecG [Actinomycetaceae bacterium]
MAAVVGDEWTAWDQPLSRVLGTRTANALAKRSLLTVHDLLLDFPFRLAHRGQLTDLSELTAGESVTVIAQVQRAHLRRMNSRRGWILTVVISDGSRDLTLTFFGKNSHVLEYHERRLSPGVEAIFSGTVSDYRGTFQLTHPDYELLDQGGSVSDFTKPIPVYHASAALPSWKVQKAVAVALASITPDDVPDPIPHSVLTSRHLPSRYQALHDVHQPADDQAWDAALRRFTFEEAFLLQTLVLRSRADAQSHSVRAFPSLLEGIARRFDDRLPFELTGDQKAVGEEISRELAQSVPMRRLLQGDVGTGKTIVALRAMLQVVASGGQAVLLAPTEVLAQQHYATISTMLGTLADPAMVDGARAGDGLPTGEASADEADDSPHGVVGTTRIALLTGSLPAAQRRIALARAASGEAGIIIGTHALLSEGVNIPFLGLVVVDEQHRFGVDQRNQLADGAHLLVMTATPIPRTLAMTFFGDLDVSTLHDKPHSEVPATSTTIVPANNRRWMDRVWERAAEEVRCAGRVFVVCPLISDTADGVDDGFVDEGLISGTEHGGSARLNRGASGDAKPITTSSGTRQTDLFSAALSSVQGMEKQLKANPVLAGIPIGILHGQLSAEEKQAAMDAFISGDTPILIATTVIEVGVDVPDATMMVVMDGERFGLSQLHQLRGRVGRGDRAAICLVVTHAVPGSRADQRLAAFAETNDGFELAEKDLQMRSEGDVLGASQSGKHSHLRLLSVVRDAALIQDAREAAGQVFASDTNLAEHDVLRRAVEDIQVGRPAEYLHMS